jgi:hypothetical protein
MEEVETVADRIARNGPLSLKNIKESVITCMGLPIKEGLMREYKLGREVFDSKDAREGPKAFMENATPSSSVSENLSALPIAVGEREVWDGHWRACQITCSQV